MKEQLYLALFDHFKCEHDYHEIEDDNYQRVAIGEFDEYGEGECTKSLVSFVVSRFNPFITHVALCDSSGNFWFHNPMRHKQGAIRVGDTFGIWVKKEVIDRWRQRLSEIPCRECQRGKGKESV